MNMDFPIPKEAGSLFQIVDGRDQDFDRLPNQIDMSHASPKKQLAQPDVELGPLIFDYSKLREEVKTSASKLRLLKNERGDLLGFSVFSTGQEKHLIKLLWVEDSARGSGAGLRLINDALMQLQGGQVDMDIWGGEPMVRLAIKCGFEPNPGGEMANRYSFNKTQ